MSGKTRHINSCSGHRFGIVIFYYLHFMLGSDVEDADTTTRGPKTEGEYCQYCIRLELRVQACRENSSHILVIDGLCCRVRPLKEEKMRGILRALLQALAVVFSGTSS